MVLLRLLGGLSIDGGRGALPARAAQRHRLALLALLAEAQPDGVSRDKLIACLWPESDDRRARNLLNQSVHALRTAFGGDAIRSSGDTLQLAPEVVTSDLRRFEDAAAARRLQEAADLYGGPFLDGFFLSGSVEFERWMDTVRDRCRRAHLAILEQLATEAWAREDAGAAAGWWRRAVDEDPLSTRVTLHLMEALEAAGDRAGALRQAQSHSALLRDELQAEPDAAVLALAERIRKQPAVPARRARTAADAIAEPKPEVGTVIPRSTHRARQLRFDRVAAAGALMAVAAAAWPMMTKSASDLGDASALRAMAVDPRAEGAYLQGLFHLERVQDLLSLPMDVRAEDRQEAARQLETAVALDPRSAKARARLARAYAVLSAEPAGQIREEYARKSRELAERALELNGNEAEAHAVLASLRLHYDRDLAGAERAAKRAMELDPQAHHWLYAQVLLAARRDDEAIVQLRKAQARNPLSERLKWQTIQALVCADRLEEALAEARQLEDRMGGRARAARVGVASGAGVAPWIAQILSRMGRHEDAVAVAEEHVVQTDSLGAAVLGLAYIYARAGRLDEARRLAERIEWQSRARGRVYRPAHLYAALGDRERALGMVEEAAAQRETADWILRCTETYMLLRHEPRMRTIEEQLGLARQNRTSTP